MQCYVVRIVQIFIDDDVHHRQRQRDVCTGVDRDVPIGARGSARPVRIDHNQLGAIASRLFNKGPKMDVVAMKIEIPPAFDVFDP